MIDREEDSVKFDGSDVIESGDTVTFDETVVLVHGRPVIVTAKGSTIEINREEVL